MQAHLERIIIFNFKSFKGKVIIGPMKSFTAIIGANGSGKSNLMDAISFVMGEKTRNLRVKQLNELIYGASRGKPIANRAYVKAIFLFEDNSSKTFMRIIHDTYCENRIDNQVVAVQFYMSELRKLNLNVKAKNFLIFQGTIESIVTKTSKEYTCMFEEISNSIELKEEYDRLKIEMIKADENVKYTFKKRKDLRLRKKYILLEKERIDKYTELHNQYLDIKNKFQLFELFHLQKDIEELQTTLNTVELKINEHERDKEAINDLLKQKKNELQIKLIYLENNEQDLAKIEEAFKQKETDFIVAKEKVLCWQEKLNSANLLSAEAHKSNEVHMKTIKELKNELMQIEQLKTAFEENMSTQLLSQGSSIELNDIQVQEYFHLKKLVELQTAKDVQVCNFFEREQSTYQNKLDNENRKKFELETKLHQKKMLRDETEKYLKNIQQHMKNITNQLTEKTNRKNNLENTIIKQREEMETVQQEFNYVSEQLSNVKVDKYVTLRLNKEAETVKLLQGLFSGVYGRLYSLCKPIHSRYEIAMTKVFGKHCNSIIVSTNNVAMQCIHYLKEQRIGVEMFLPVVSLKVEPIKEKLRGITNPKNVKLLYDVLQFSSEEISNAILFVTNNVLVCETPDDARMLAYETDPYYKFNCVALDGTYYKKEGIISGGQVELLQKAKVWQEEELMKLKSKKITLMEKLKEQTTITQKEFEMSTLDIQIHELMNRLKYYRLSLVEVENKIATLQIETEVTESELEIVDNNITSIKEIMKSKNHDIQTIENSVTDIQNTIFQTFCKNIGVNNIRQYEQGNLRTYQEQMKKKLELEEQYSRIQNLLEFEMKRDTKCAVLKIKDNIKIAKQELENARREEALNKIVIEKELDKLNNMRMQYNEGKASVTEQEININECRHRIGVIAKAINNVQKERLMIVTMITKKKGECRTIIKNSKTENIPIPLLSDNAEDFQNDIITSDSTLNVEQQQDMGIFFYIDFNRLPESLRSRVKEDISNSRSKLTTKIQELQHETKSIKDLNFKANEELESIIEKLKITNTEYKEARKDAIVIKKQFEAVKQERYNRFSSSLEHIDGQLDAIYKCLVNDQLAQAILLPENTEEPYLGGISFSYVAPGKRFQPLSNFSGGEKALAALALLFAIHSFRPAPFFISDEIDAALDNTNIENVVRFIRTKTKEIQVITISLKRRLYTHADALIGICTGFNGEYPESLVYTLSLEKYPSSHEKENRI